MSSSRGVEEKIQNIIDAYIKKFTKGDVIGQAEVNSIAFFRKLSLNDQQALDELKLLARQTSSNVAVAFELLLNKLEAKKAVVRLGAVMLIDALFVRSRQMRQLVVAQINRVLESMLLIERGKPSPTPAAAATQLRDRCTTVVERWHEEHGAKPEYKPLQLAYNYLKHTLGVAFPDVTAQRASREEQKLQRERQRQRVLRVKFERLEDELKRYQPNVEELVRSCQTCFDVLIPAKDNGVETSAVPSDFGEFDSDDEEEEAEKSAKAVAACVVADMFSDAKAERSGKRPSESNGDRDSPAGKRLKGFKDDVRQSEEGEHDSQSELIKQHSLGTRNYQLNLEITLSAPALGQDTRSEHALTLLRKHQEHVEKVLYPLTIDWVRTITQINLDMWVSDELHPQSNVAATATGVRDQDLHRTRLQYYTRRRDKLMRDCMDAKERLTQLRQNFAKLGLTNA